MTEAKPGGADLRTLVACPVCHVALTWAEASAQCARCGRTFVLREGIPVLLLGEACEQKEGQAAFFDDADPEWEISRPHGAPRWHRWLLAEKVRRGLTDLDALLDGAVTLTVCGGSGMDAEFLARRGAYVITADVSFEAARRARERARRFGVDIAPIVADAEQLPFADRSVDLAYVHDGLHHLETPLAGLAEMARVARRAVSINEPARAVITEWAVRIGVAQEVEEAGNRVARMDPQEVASELRALGFDILRAERYAMFYRHEPGLPSAALSMPPVFTLARAALKATNAVVGRFGNKLAVQAARKA